MCLAQHASPPSVLIIEDEPLIALELEQFVQGMGLSVCGVADRRAQAVAEARAHRPDLILSDIRLRDGDNGMDAVDEIRGFSDAPVIIVSGSARDVDRRRLAGCQIVPKPYDPHELAQAIRMAVPATGRA